MKRLSCFLVICSFVCIVGKVGATGYLTYSFDDGHISAYTKAYPILAAHGQVGTANPVLDRILSGKSWCMNVQQLLELEAAGWEICSHSVTHPGLANLPLTYADETSEAPNSAERELEMSKIGFIDLGLNVQNFVVPGSNWNDDLATLSASYYNSAASGGRSGNTLPLENRWWIRRKNVSTSNSVSDITALIEREINDNKWLILIFHKICENENCGGYEPWSETKLDELATWVEDQGISVVTQQQGLELSTGDGRAEIIGTWDSGIWYRNMAASSWKKMYSGVPSGDIAADDFTGDGKADVASIWDSGLWYQNGKTLGWTKVTSTAPYELAAGDVTGDGRAEIIGTWGSGIWYRDVAKSKWTQMNSYTTDGDIAAGDFTGDKKADVASSWSSGLWYQNGATLNWTKVTSVAPNRLTAGDVTGDGRAEIIGTWDSGIWYRNMAASSWKKMYSGVPSGDIAADDFTGDGKADVASIWDSGLWYQNGKTLGWTKVTSTAPYELAAGDMTGN